MRSSGHPAVVASTPSKRLGGYLVEAGLLTTAQVDVALNDQKITGMRFGEILVVRGWVKKQTIDFIMKRVILPERQQRRSLTQQALTQQTVTQQNSAAVAAATSAAGQATAPPLPSGRLTGLSTSPDYRRDLPMSRPFPEVAAADSDVSWVG